MVFLTFLSETSRSIRQKFPAQVWDLQVEVANLLASLVPDVLKGSDSSARMTTDLLVQVFMAVILSSLRQGLRSQDHKQQSDDLHRHDTPHAPAFGIGDHFVNRLYTRRSVLPVSLIPATAYASGSGKNQG